MRSIPSQFRAMSSSKRLPTEPSHFVSLIFRPLKAFFGIGSVDGPAAALKDELLISYAEEVFEAVAQRYAYNLLHFVQDIVLISSTDTSTSSTQ